LAYNPDDGFLYTMSSFGGFQRYSITGMVLKTLQSPIINVQGLTYIGGDQFVGIRGNALYQYDNVDDNWLLLSNTLSQSFENAGLAYDEGVLFAITSNSDQLFTIDLIDFNVTALGSRGSLNGGGLSTLCKFFFGFLSRYEKFLNCFCRQCTNQYCSVY
jgi:hypothetical protein